MIKQIITNTATRKIGPHVVLSTEQRELVLKIMNFTRDRLQNNQTGVFTIFGDAGTGKSVILSHLFAKIQLLARTDNTSALYRTRNYFLVNHPEVLKVYKAIAGSNTILLKKDYQRPTTFINQLDKHNQAADIVLIDEAHLLLSKSDHYNNFYFHNQLQEIIKRSKVVILVFDQTQVLRMKSYWTNERLNALLTPYPHENYVLKKQFRMSAGPELLDWINQLTLRRTVTELTPEMLNNYDFRIYDDAEEMRKAIVMRNQQVGLSRILSTSGYPSTLDGGKHYICEGKFKMPWDQYNYTETPWAEIPATIDEVGSIYTCQGFDLNYAGIIIGPPIYLRDAKHGRLDVDLTKHTDVEAFKKRDDLTDLAMIESVEKKMVMNSLNVLLKRGVYGTYLYVHDPQLRRLLLKQFEKITQK